tara:strand:- start:33 stop:245 length:213 start_codon:yes stop_codon:yes gene_type:complete
MDVLVQHVQFSLEVVAVEIFIVQLDLVDLAVAVLVLQDLTQVQLLEYVTLAVAVVEKDQLLENLVMVDQE